MSSAQDPSRRAARLHNLFRDTVSGKRGIRSPQDAQLFLEALRGQQSPTQCVEVLVSSEVGLSAVSTAIRADLSLPFVLSHILPTLRYLAEPSVKALVGGQLLERVLTVVANPPTVVNALVDLFNAGQVPDDGLYAFAWLALELISLRPEVDVDVTNVRKAISDGERFLKSQDHATRELGYRITKVIKLLESPGRDDEAGGPGGRHENDFADFRRIRIYPTSDEFLSTQLPYYRTAQEVLGMDVDSRSGAHLDNQFRLLREDLLSELREDIQVATGKRKGRRSALILGNLDPISTENEDTLAHSGRPRYKKSTLLVRCFDGLEWLRELEPTARKKYLTDQPGLLRHQAFGVLCRGEEIFGFAFVERNIDNLMKSPPVVSLQFTDDEGLRRALLALTLPKRELVQFVLVDTPVFAYEPVLLGLQRLSHIPLLDLLVNPTSISDSNFEVPRRLLPFVESLKALARRVGSDGAVRLLRSTREVKLDESQLAALLLALTSPVSLIQGPPGTGKSFIGAEIALSLFEAGLRILVLSYTNHATDQFLEDLLQAGIPDSCMVRLGSRHKCSPRTAQLLLSGRGGYRRSREAWSVINALEREAEQVSDRLRNAFREFKNFSAKWDDISEYLEFSDDGHTFLEALRVPSDASDWARAGKKGKKIGPDYLYQQWTKGGSAGQFGKELPVGAMAVWEMPRSVRDAYHEKWVKALVEERVQEVQQLARQANQIQERLDALFSEADAHAVLQKKIIGCTTTAAAKYDRLIRAAKPDVILVEEAGEILECHILTALAPTVKQVVLIGDHKQLRPKINNYALSVEKGEGFDLNLSLFERLINQGARHATLQRQHRMAPEISTFARELTYPNLLDGPKTGGRPQMLGLQDRVVFLNHSKLEDSDRQVRDRRDPGMKESKRNKFEAEMVLRCVKYLGQQGYSSDQIVILTPYLGQLRVLQDLLRQNQHDSALSEMDKNELIRAGLISEATAKVDKKPLRVSTIDNYQGEESDIVIASLTRSNGSGDIGFMSAPERLNVLITRARNCMILIGNMDTFMKSEKGTSTWHPFFDSLKAKGHLYDGLPVYCGKHPEKKELLKEPMDFDKRCPDGGCTEICNAPLKCGVHKCRSRCHRVVDHSRAECHELVQRVCERQHKSRVRCGREKDGCHQCIEEDKETERRARRDLKLEEDRRRREEEYTRQLREIEDEQERQRRINKYEAEEEMRMRTLDQRRAELAALKDTERKLRQRNRLKAEAAAKVAEKAAANASKPAAESFPTTGMSSPPPDWGEDAKAEWEFLKQFEGAESKPIDDLMEMIGLEAVKQEFLNVKSKVDTALRQGISMDSERFSCSMLGNPGTGKTTVARLYAQLLTDLCVIPGSRFEETTGAGLANMGVPGCKSLIENILNEGGGVLFIDEAYQLTSGNSPGGGAVLDYLLAEVENLRGKMVFILAGYNKQMEAFFAHNPGLPSRFPVEMTFADYVDEELLRILALKINKKYNGAMTCEDGLTGLYCRIVSRRIGRGRGKEGFGNARSIENALDQISRRQAERLRRARKTGANPDLLFFTKEDLIGPEPGEALAKCEAWKRLQDLIGLVAVKEAIQSLVGSIKQNYDRELQEQPPIQYSLNKVFLGNPGTGKTTVAKLYGEILLALGLLSKGEVVVKNPSDFVGAHLGQSEQQTKGILAATVGKVLLIDEAYGLYGGAGSAADPYKTAVIDTIVAEVQSVPGDDRCVLLLGYKDQMENMFQNVNPGLSRRFPIASAFHFDDFSDDELRTIFACKVKQQGYQVTGQATNVAMEMLKRARNRPNFGNAGEIDIILDATKARHQTRFSKGHAKSAVLLEAVDFDENFDRAERAETNIRMLFEGTVGCEEIVSLLEGYQDTVRAMRACDMDPKENIPFNFLFRGPPGTGKTTTAKKMGKVFYDMGFLAAAEVVECSATDLIGQYVGQTGPKVQQLLDKALGKVLFVDEAYRLAEGHFAKEAMDEIVDSVTKERYHKRLVIILAGYEADINRLMSVNSGLTSRFPEVINFRGLAPGECVALLLKLLREQKATLSRRSKDLDLSCLQEPRAEFKRDLLQTFAHLAAQDNWASARDVQSAARGVFNRVIRDKEGRAKGCFTLTETAVTEELRAMLQERASRSSASDAPKSLDTLHDLFQQRQQHQQHLAAPEVPFERSHLAGTIPTSQSQSQSQQPDKPVDLFRLQEKPASPPLTSSEPVSRRANPASAKLLAKRDAGVSDGVWAQLQRDAEAQEQRDREHRQLCEAARNATDEARERIVAKLLEEEARRKREEKMKAKLKAMGLCPAGYEWIRQASGWRCAGGSHYMGDGQL